MKKIFKAVLIIIGVIVFIGYFYGSGLESHAEIEINKIEVQVAEDAIKQYEIAKRSGSDLDAYTQASYVAAAFLQANDEANYKKWKEIEKEEANKIGL